MRLAILFASLLVDAALGADAPPVDVCPGAATWNREHGVPVETVRANSNGSTLISAKDLLGELQVRVETDQAARKRWLAEQGNAQLANAVFSIDSANLTWLRKLISEKGFPTAAQVGIEGVHLAWVLVQHADQDPKLQSDLIPVMEERFFAGELPANDLARITDRVLVAGGKPQRYGTQYDWFAGDFTLPEPEKLVEIDAARSRLGLMPLADYLCTLRVARKSVM